MLKKTQNSFQKTIVLLITLSLLQSCIGLGFGVVKGEIDTSVKVKGDEFVILSNLNKGEFARKNIRYELTKQYYKKPKTYTKKEVLSLWGTPSHKKTDKKTGQEVWVYKRELAWSGVYAFISIVIPIPLPIIVPVGTRNTELYFAKDKLDAAVRYDGFMSGYAAICGISDSPNLCHIGKTE